jgi:hypothetical protein
MMNGEERAPIRATPSLIDTERQLSIRFRATALDDRSLTEDAAIWRYTIDLQLEDTAVLEN